MGSNYESMEVVSMCLICCKTFSEATNSNERKSRGTGLELLFEHLRLETELGIDSVGTCGNCSFVLEDYGKIYEDWKAVELQLQTRIKEISNIVRSASHVLRRREGFKTWCSNQDNCGEDKMGTVLKQLRSSLRQKCKKILTEPLPKVQLFWVDQVKAQHNLGLQTDPDATPESPPRVQLQEETSPLINSRSVESLIIQPVKKRGPGRPRKHFGTKSVVNQPVPEVKRGRERPRKHFGAKSVVNQPVPGVKRGRGRPRKNFGPKAKCARMSFFKGLSPYGGHTENTFPSLPSPEDNDSVPVVLEIKSEYILPEDFPDDETLESTPVISSVQLLRYPGETPYSRVKWPRKQCPACKVGISAINFEKHVKRLHGVNSNLSDETSPRKNRQKTSSGATTAQPEFNHEEAPGNTQLVEFLAAHRLQFTPRIPMLPVKSEEETTLDMDLEAETLFENTLSTVDTAGHSSHSMSVNNTLERSCKLEISKEMEIVEFGSGATNTSSGRKEETGELTRPFTGPEGSHDDAFLTVSP